MVEVLREHGMRMQLEAAQVRHPRQRRRIARDDLLGGAAGREAERDDLDPLRARVRGTLLVEELAVDPVRVTDEDIRPAARPPQRALRDGNVIPDDVELGDTGLGEVHLAGVRDRDLAPRDLEDDRLRLARHGPSIRLRALRRVR
jgi:hypothetical protein